MAKKNIAHAEMARAKLKKYHRMADACAAVINELKQARSEAQFWDNLVLGCSITIGVCDGIVAVLGETAAGGVMKNVYEVGKNLGAADGAARVGDGGGMATGFGKAAVAGLGIKGKGVIGHGPGTHGQKAVGEAAVDLHLIMMNGAIDAASKGGIEDEDMYKSLISLGVLGTTTTQKLAGNKTASKVIGRLQGMAKSGSKLGQALKSAKHTARNAGPGKIISAASGVSQAAIDANKARNDYLKSGAQNDEYFNELKVGMVQKLTEIRAHIILLEAEVYNADFQALRRAHPGQAAAIKMQSMLNNRI